MESAIFLKSELDLFQSSSLQLAIDNSSFVEIHPLSSLSDKTPIEFYISGNGEHYLDLAHSILHLQIRIVKTSGLDLVAADEVAPINYILNTLFSECSVFLNEKQVSSQINYSYRSLLESLLFYSKSGQDSLLSAALFHKDTAGQHDSVGVANEGFTARGKVCRLSKKMQLTGPLHIDLASQPKLLINGVNVRIKLEKNKHSFALMSANDHYRIIVDSASLYVRKINVAPSVMLAHEKALSMGVIKMPIRRVEVKTYALSSGLQSTIMSNVFVGQLPTRLILGFVSNAAYNGNISKNPFKFSNYDLNYLCALNGSSSLPSKAYQPNFADDMYARSYLGLFLNLNRYHNSPNINISYGEYKNGYALYAIDLTPDLAAGESHSSINKTGNLAFDIKFNTALPETVTLVVYAEYRNLIEIDKSRGVTTDF